MRFEGVCGAGRLSQFLRISTDYDPQNSGGLVAVVINLLVHTSSRPIHRRRRHAGRILESARWWAREPDGVAT